VKKLIRPCIHKIKPYQPGKPIEEVAREIGVEKVESIIKLASNENPLGPSPRALAAVQPVLSCVNLYPDGSAYYLKQALSGKLKLPAECIIVGNGSNEIIELIMHVFVGAGHKVVYAHPSFLVYRLVATMFGAEAVEVPLKGFVHDLPAMLRAIDSKTRVVIIANPNNPTGTALPPAELERFLRLVPDSVIVVLDEAYYEYLPPELRFNALPWLEQKKVILLRTFSKIYGLAGLRIGFGLASEECVEILNRVRQPFNTSSLAQAAARGALEDAEHVKRTLENNQKGLEMLGKGFRQLDLEYVPSVANFILVRVGEAKRVFHRLLEKGIIVRPMDFYDLPEYLRITVGLPEENERLLRELEVVLKEDR